MNETDLTGCSRDEEAGRKVRHSLFNLIIAPPLFGSFAAMFYFGFTDARTHAIYAGGVFAGLAAVLFLYAWLRRYRCRSCGAPMRVEWHDVRPGDRAHSDSQGSIPAGFTEEVTYTVGQHPFCYHRTYRQVHTCRPCRRYFWGQVFRHEGVAGTLLDLKEYEAKRRVRQPLARLMRRLIEEKDRGSGKKAGTEMRRLARRMLRLIELAEKGTEEKYTRAMERLARRMMRVMEADETGSGRQAAAEIGRLADRMQTADT